MLKLFKFESPDISIDCKYGINFMYNLSATGKSYAARILSSLSNKSIKCFIFNNNSTYSTFFEVSNKFTEGCLIFLDRCDMFLTKEIVEYVKNRKDIIILMDLKLVVKFINITEIEFTRVVVDSDTKGKVIITDDINIRRQWVSEHECTYI